MITEIQNLNNNNNRNESQININGNRFHFMKITKGNFIVLSKLKNNVHYSGEGKIFSLDNDEVIDVKFIS